MLLYEIQHPGFEGYNARYEAKDPLFAAAAPASLVFMRRMMDLVAPRDTVAALDIGCGQGYFTTLMREHLDAARPGKAPAWVLGFDGAGVAVRQADGRDPKSQWATDTLQHFLDVHEEKFPGQRYDLIVDRGGTTVIASEDEAIDVTRRIHDLLKPGGFYVFQSAMAWYRGGGTVKPPHLNWTRDWMSVVAANFDCVMDGTGSGFHQVAYMR